MPKSCSAYSCTNRYRSDNPKITFHRFPLSKPSVLKQWLENLGREDFQPKKHMVICSLHFTPDCFSGLGNRKNLLWNAVPTLFTKPQKNSKVYSHRRKSKKKPLVTEENIERRDGCAKEGSVALDEVAPDEVFEGLTQPTGIREPVIHQADPRVEDFRSLDHNYALLDPNTTKVRLFDALEANQWLLKRLKAKCQVIKRIKLKLQVAQKELRSLHIWCNQTRSTRYYKGQKRVLTQRMKPRRNPSKINMHCSGQDPAD
ncbi:THAP domain-containing protein 3 [Chanos chanos]|uniref:THAP domain-containing protein 3 n=1 Tax=Chanos chanos TaxID=29144 RepID=A0A6J2V110_CHACN|nr:THAP domain-containing protein 3-like [Chanos chanos]